MGKKIEKVRKSRKKGRKSGCACAHTREPLRGHEVTSLPVRENNTGKKYGEKNENEKNNGNLKKLNKNKLKKIEKNEEKKLKKVRKKSAENPKKKAGNPVAHAHTRGNPLGVTRSRHFRL